MHIVSCFKVVPEEQDIVVTPDQKLSFDRADFKISQFDLNGIEAAVQLAGEGSGDLYAQQTGLLAARILGVPCVNAVSSIEKTEAGIRVERSLENEVEVIELPLPAAVCVTSDINVPRIPTMKAILGAGKKPAKTLSTADIGWSAPAKTVELDAIEVPPRKERAHEVLEGDSAVADFAARIKSALK